MGDPARPRVTGPGFGLQLPTVDPGGDGLPDLRTAARRAEGLGFDSVWVGDHLAFHCPYEEALTTLSIAGAVTERVALGIGVLLLAMRSFPWTVKQLGTMQHHLGDRLVLGIGVGGENPVEWEATGVPSQERGRRTDAMLAALGPALDGEPTRVEGRDVPALRPHGARPPLWVGGRSEAAMERTARHADGFLGLWLDDRGIGRTREDLAARTAALGRPMPRVALNVPVFVADDRADAEAAVTEYLDGVFRLPLDRVARYAVLGTHDEVVARLGTFLGAGLDGMVMLVAGPTPRYDEQVERLAAVVADLRVAAPRITAG